MQPNFQLQNCFFNSIFEIFTHKKENPNIEKHLRFLIRFLYFLRSLANLFLCTANLCNCSFPRFSLLQWFCRFFFVKISGVGIISSQITFAGIFEFCIARKWPKTQKPTISLQNCLSSNKFRFDYVLSRNNSPLENSLTYQTE